MNENSVTATDEMADFFRVGPGFDQVKIEVKAPETPLAILEKLGPSPFERGHFPFIGFLATTYERVSRFALGETTGAP